MGFIGRQPTPAPLTSSDITDGIISTSKLANDAVDNTKLDLTDNYAFTGTITGAGGGKLLQCLQYTMGSATVTSSTSYVNFSSMLVTITPSATSSKILLLHSAPSTVYTDNNSNMGNVAIFRDSTNITTLGHNTSFASYQFTDHHSGSAITYLDSPNSTSALEYRVKVKCDNSGLQFVYGSSYSNGSQPRQSSLIAMEIGA